MKLVITIAADGAEKYLNAGTGELISTALARYGIGVDMPCGGGGRCGKCVVSVNGEMCLACQTKVERDIRVELTRQDGIQNIAVGEIQQSPPLNPIFSQFGISVDIGTTTVCASLLDKSGGVYTAVGKNPQASFGADVISRIEKALAGNGKDLAKCIRCAIAQKIAELCGNRGVSANLIDGAVITGNTAMLYLLEERNPEALSRAPFLADRLFGEYIEAKVLGLPISPDARVFLPRCVSAFVGGDIVCAILSSKMCSRFKTAMLLDIGTNGEIALWHGKKLICCSTAAGPALEGAGITHGVCGINGAIDRVWLEDGQTRYSTIGGAKAAGICGSGMVDALAVMLKLKTIDETGAFSGGSDLYELGGGIYITQGDIRAVQLAKGAVRAGIETLLEVAGIDKSEVEALYIAGGFGSFINLRNAAEIGLIPKEFLGRARAIGNAAHNGAAMLLRDQSLIGVSDRLARLAQTIPLNANQTFINNYMDYMMFGL
jgi:uncharacterized 2Fe-2S/4Fe-4S cluster protein (DUF4445 family)